MEKPKDCINSYVRHLSSVPRQGRDPPQSAEGAQWPWWSRSFVSQRYLQECPFSAHRQVHGGALRRSKGGSAAEGLAHLLNALMLMLFLPPFCLASACL